MIIFVRTAGIAPGKNASMLAFSKEIVAYIKDAYKFDVEVLLPIGGNPQRIGWTSRHKDLAEYDSVNLRLIADPKYWEILNKYIDSFMPGSAHDEIWRTL
ncbi:hypothetical protein [Variovorax sp. Sphag1AA]|uniref:hypothetical protein n=1 Tax=Variovorax sp. Sphag1AA TaxID=2587027 RepID=UPI00160DA671|nr:hypothetical protein [Variovorax sp. Sphag1AA]MBB3180281.1 hypothetical protein [Variovorax sp. Sphag1AA]MBO9648465.1 hypothetical protein [Variovorax sp.]